MSKTSRWGRLGAGALLLALASLGGPATQAASVKSQNLVDLIQLSDRIIVGTVESVSDGFDQNNVPYTEVTLRVSESIRGDKGETLSFRQFGLMQPREIDGRTYLGVTPDGWPTWSERERVMLFLGRPAHLTGLRTTVGLEQGKLQMSDGKLTSGARNIGMFKGVRVTAGGLTNDQVAMLESDGAAVDASPFIGLVRRAVNENWIESGVLRHEN